jgi:hypothetical protein
MSFFDSLKEWFSSSAPTKEPLLPEREIKELAVKLALSGNGLHLERKRIEDYYKDKEASLNIKFAGEKSYFDEQMGHQKAGLQEQQRIKDDSRGRLAKLEDEQTGLRAEAAAERSRHDGAWQEILRHRYSRGKQFLDEQSEKIAASLEQDWDQIKKAIGKQLEIEREVYKIQLENYEINKEELNRRAGKCDEEQEKVEKRLEKAQAQLDLLKTFGITWQSARFLLIVGVLSLAGAGSIVANLLQDRTPGDDLITWLIKSISEFLNTMIPAGWPPWVSLLKPFIFVGVVCLLLGIFYLLVVFMDRLVKKFDAKWGVEASEPETERRETGRPRERDREKARRKNFLGSLEDALGEQQGLKSYFNFIPLKIDRQDYTRLLASFPYIFLIGAIIFLLSGRVSGSSFTLSTAYIGVIVVLLTASCCVIYVTKVIEPRWLRYAAQVASQVNGQAGQPPAADAAPQKSPGFFWVHREISLLLLLLVFSLALAALLPTKEVGQYFPGLPGMRYFDESVFKHAVWGSLSIFVSLSSLGLAYGIVQQGLFQDAERLEGRRRLMRELAERFRSKPVIGGTRYYQYDYPDDLIEQLDHLHELEDRKTWFEFNEIFADDYEFVSLSNDYTAAGDLGRTLLRSRNHLLRQLRRKSGLVRELRPVDFANVPEAAAQYMASGARIAQAEEKMRLNYRDMEDLRARINAADARQKESEQKLLDLIKQRNDAESDFLKQRDALRDSKERDLIIFTAAYTIGSVANKLFRDEDILASDLIKMSGPQDGAADPHAAASLWPKVPPPLPAPALWLSRRALVTVFSAEERVEGQPQHYRIRESETLIPESDLRFLPAGSPMF